MSEHFAGVDTHADFHVVAVIDDVGRHLDHHQFDNTVEGLAAATAYLAAAGVVRVGVEGTSSYGAGLARTLVAAGISVCEVTRPNRAERRRLGKSDTIDAFQAAQAALTGNRTSPAKVSERLLELRIHYVLRESALKARTQVGNELHHLHAMLNPGTRLGKLTITHVRRLADTNSPLAIAAQRWLTLNTEADHHHKAIRTWLTTHYPAVLAPLGVGPVSAAALILAAGDNPDRMTSEATFARLCGAAPINASSGKHQHNRLNRGGDRQANRALWTIAHHRARHDQRTKDYITRRRDNDHLKPRAIQRCLKRYICRELFPLLTPQPLDNQ